MKSNSTATGCMPGWTESEAALSNAPLVFGALLVVGAMGTLICGLGDRERRFAGCSVQITITPSASERVSLP